MNWEKENIEQERRGNTLSIQRRDAEQHLLAGGIYKFFWYKAVVPYFSKSLKGFQIIEKCQRKQGDLSEV